MWAHSCLCSNRNPKVRLVFFPIQIVTSVFCDEMNSDEVQSLRFLAGSFVAKNKLQDVETAQQLFVILEKAQVLVMEDVHVLKQMTASLDRRDLFDKILEYEAVRSGSALPLRMPSVPSFRPTLMPSLPGGLNDKAFPSILNPDAHVFVLRATASYTPPLVPKRESARQLPTKSQPAVEMDRALTPPIDSGPNKAQLAAQLQREAEEMVRVRQQQRLQEINKGTVKEKKGGVGDLKELGDVLRREFEENRTEARNAEIQREKDEMPCYKMDAKPRGICVIINNQDFYQIRGDPRSKLLPEREGTDIDCNNLDYVWKKLQFHVEKLYNLSDSEIMRTLAHFAYEVDHSQFDCFVCCILTHGMMGGIYGVNGKFLEIKDVTSVFKAVQCPSLAGKPKLFFLQACQGRARQHGIANLEADGPDSPTVLPLTRSRTRADFLLGYATIPGYVSYRSRSMGSWYITKLVEMLDKYADKYDLLSILIKVNEEVGKAVAQVEDQMYKQSPAPMPTLRKKIYFM